MTRANIPRLDLRDLRAGGARADDFVSVLGDALSEVGFFALTGHDIDDAVLGAAYDRMQAFFALGDDDKRRFFAPEAMAQRGYTPFRAEHAAGAKASDLKEFFQVGRVDVDDDHPVHARYGKNLWPDAFVPGFEAAMRTLYTRLDAMAGELLAACARFLDEDAAFFTDAVKTGDTILRLIHYPALGEVPPPDAVRAGAHEDINFITLLCGATAEGLELKERDGSWRAVEAGHDDLIVDTGDMMQNVTNGVLRSVTHRVVVTESAKDHPRYSMPFFVHPRGDVDLTPRPGCVKKSGGVARYPALDARTLLEDRLRAIGVA